MMPNVHIAESAELYALGLLDERENAALESHIAHCADCRRLVGEAEETVLEMERRLPPAVTPGVLDQRLRFTRPATQSRLREWGALAAAFVLGILVTASVFTGWLHQASPPRDAASIAMIGSHFNHAQFTPLKPNAPAAKVIYARDRSWIYVLVAGKQTYDVYAVSGRSAQRLGATRPADATSELFISPAPSLATIELRAGESAVARAHLR